jgi:hypothetical protein
VAGVWNARTAAPFAAQSTRCAGRACCATWQRLVHAHRDDDELHLGAVALVGRPHPGLERGAVGAPRRPELHEHGLPPKHLPEVHRPPLEVLDLDGMDDGAAGQPDLLVLGEGVAGGESGDEEKADRPKPGAGSREPGAESLRT